MQDTFQQLIAKSQQLIQNTKYDQASRLLRQAIRIDPLAAEGYHLLGLAEFQLGRFASSIELIEKSIDLNKFDPAFYNNLGLAFLSSGQAKRAIDAFTQSILIDQFYAQAWFNRANAHHELSNLELAYSDYSQALVIDPYWAQALNNLGLVLKELKQAQKAIECFEGCLQIQPDFYPAFNNIGLIRQELGENEAALNNYLQAIQLSPNYVEAHINAGHLLQNTGQYERALKHYAKAYKLVPQLDLLLGNIIQCKNMLCDWTDSKVIWRLIAKQAFLGKLPCSPFVMLSGCDDAKLALKLAQTYTDRFVATINVPKYLHTNANTDTDTDTDKSTTKIYSTHNRKLKIGYFSSDYKDHPVSYLIAGMIENHCRDFFEVIGFALATPGSDQLGQRICNSFDNLIDVSNLPNIQAVELIRAQNLDVAIDLNGYIDGGRPSLFKARIAPVQVNYYGFPGTMGADFIDYIIGDHYLMPAGFDAFYQEKIIYLPGSYQPNDDKRPIDELVNRKDHHLPEHSFVFCCFNKPYKITPAVFNCWLNILKAVENSVLWLQSSDQTVISNLKRLATKERVAPSRIIFAERVPTTATHLARYKLADLFLDTFPYTAHTTANDALWAGLPLLGLSGQTFAARVSESLLCTLGLNDWVMNDLKTYEDRAIKLGLNPEELISMRTRLEQAKVSTSLYQPAKITKWLESGLKTAHDRYIKGLSPDHIVVPND